MIPEEQKIHNLNYEIEVCFENYQAFIQRLYKINLQKKIVKAIVFKKLIKNLVVNKIVFININNY